MSFALLALVAHSATAEAPGLAGRWATVDARTQARRAVIEIQPQGTEMVGRIVELFPAAGEDADPVCDACPGSDRGQPVRGLAIVHLAPDADGKAWHGTVLDPEEGSVYRAVARLEAGGDRLVLRGYVLVPFFGRSEAWSRVH